jgi:hypothetical protein
MWTRQTHLRLQCNPLTLASCLKWRESLTSEYRERPRVDAGGPVFQGGGRADIMQFFGDKWRYGQSSNRRAGRPDGIYGAVRGTHTRATENRVFRIPTEPAIAAGVRRTEAVAGIDERPPEESERPKPWP